MADKEVTQRAGGAKVAADVGSTGASFTAYLVECLPSINKQPTARPIETRSNTRVYELGCGRLDRENSTATH